MITEELFKFGEATLGTIWTDKIKTKTSDIPIHKKRSNSVGLRCWSVFLLVILVFSLMKKF